MKFKEALRYLYSFVSYEQKTHWTYSDKTLNLDQFREFLEQLNNPQLGFKAIHVAGSDGKGSVCAMVASVLRSLGFRVGVFSSPHLHNIRERITINNDWISETDFSRWTEFLQDAAEKRSAIPQGYVTFFELITAMAFLHFRQEKVDFAVVETGLGGRLDTTNVMQPQISVITHISLEHTEQLGDTLEAIADEKLGITRPEIPAVIGHQDRKILPHFHCRLKNQQAPTLFTDSQYRVLSHSCGVKYRTLEIERISPDHLVRSIRIPLFGHYQMDNAVTALATIDMLSEQRVISPPSHKQLDEGFKNVSWPGRFEIIRRDNQPLTILDVAHTTKGAASLRTSLDEQFPRFKRTYVIGFLQDKKIREIVQTLIRPGDRFIITQAPTPRGASVEMIREAIQGLDLSGVEIVYLQSPSDALRQAQSDVSPNHLICVTGSLYLVGNLRESLLPQTNSEK